MLNHPYQNIQISLPFAGATAVQALPLVDVNQMFQLNQTTSEHVLCAVCVPVFRGNYEHELPYIEGDLCSRCPENLQKCENNLCGNVEIFPIHLPNSSLNQGNTLLCFAPLTLEVFSTSSE